MLTLVLNHQPAKLIKAWYTISDHKRENNSRRSMCLILSQVQPSFKLVALELVQNARVEFDEYNKEYYGNHILKALFWQIEFWNISIKRLL